MIMAQIIRLTDKVRMSRPVDVREESAEVLPVAPKKPAEQLLNDFLVVGTSLLLIESAILIVQRLLER